MSDTDPDKSRPYPQHCRTDLIDNGRGLEPVGEDDVGVHGPYVQVVDNGVLQPSRRVPAELFLFYTCVLCCKIWESIDLSKSNKLSHTGSHCL